ncbi:MAG: SusC/RagA family TonB-linked outer membrane protein, partial [Bacteroides sp.]|nr:SusC/RagA family TonB-linked outer membrane protein [Bacteroides sp.]
KGPAAAALYGSRAAAGVIIITTKKGNTDGTTEVTVSSKLTTSWANRLPEQQRTYKRGEYLENGNLKTDWTYYSWGEKFGSGEKVYDNISDFFKTGASYDNTVTVSGGSQAGSFYLSVARFDQTGIVPKTGFDKTTFRFNGDRHYGNFTIAANVAFSVSSTDKTLTSSGLWDAASNGAMETVYTWARSEDMKHYLNEDGSKYRIFQSLDPSNDKLADDQENPYWIIHKNKMTDKTTRFTGSVAPSYKITDWLHVNYRVGLDRYTTNDYTYIAAGGAVKDTYQDGRLSTSDLTYEYLTSNLIVTANQKVGDFDLNLLVGQSAEDTKVMRERRTGYKFEVPDFASFENIDDSRKFFESYSSRKRLMGVYGEFRAAYKSLAYITVTGRNDWTSTLPTSNRSYFYPSVSGSLVFSELLPENQILSFGKIRASWARVGKDTDAYALETALWSPRSFLSGVGTGNSWTKGNPNLKPEITESTELGLEMRFLQGRLGFDLTYYTNNSKNQIVSPRLSQTNGYIMYSNNIGNVYNKGMELAISAQPIRTRDWSWDMMLNVAGNRGTVKNLLQGMELLYVTDVQIGGAKAASVDGGKFMALTGYAWNRDDDGNVILSADGMPTHSSDATQYIGNREPTFSGGFSNNIQYKNWSLSLMLDFRVGGLIYNGTDYYMTTYGMSKRTENRDKIVLEGVVVGDDGKYVPKTFTYEAGKTYQIGDTERTGEYMIQEYYSKYYNKEASHFATKPNWLRLRGISLSYSIPTTALAKTKFIKGCTFSLAGDNLLVWTNYKGLDPENSVAGSGVTGSSSTGIDYCGVPSTASMSFGVNLRF